MAPTLISTSSSSVSSVDPSAESPPPFLFAILENAELGIVAVDRSSRVIYMNRSARDMLDSAAGELPGWVLPQLGQTLEALASLDERIERWEHAELALRVRARRLGGQSNVAVLELRPAQSAGGQIADQLARGLGLTNSDGKLLALLWRGLSNDEIAHTMNIRVGTVKSRLFRLYQRLGVKRRPAAVLRAAEVLAA